MDRVLLTGGTGFIGNWMRRTVPPGLELTYLNQWEYTHKFWDNARWDYVVHLAPVSPLRALNCNPRRLLFASSGAVYNQHTDYAENKRKWEAQCMNSGRDVVIARLFTFYGEWLDGNKAITQFVRAAREGKPLRIWGDGNTVRSYMHGATMAKWLWTILLHGERGEAYDVGSAEEITMLELARMVNQTFGNHSAIIIEFQKEIAPYYVPANLAKTSKLIDNFCQSDLVSPSLDS